MNTIKIVLWNVYKKDMTDTLPALISENEVDILVLIEAEKIPSDKLIKKLDEKGYKWREVAIKPESDIIVFSKYDIKIIPNKEDKNFSTYKVYQNGRLILMHVVHLPSAMFKSEEARNHRAQDISKQLEKIEEEVFGEDEYTSIVMGDFNLQPYSYGIIGALGFNATMSMYKAKKKKRIVGGEECLFYFNPVWELMGKNRMVQGSYYCGDDQDDKSLFWYAFDEVLIRPSLIDCFSWEYFEYITEICGEKLMTEERINKKDYSDHLPIRFEIMEG